MTQYSFFGVNGNGTSGPASSTAFGGNIVVGLAWKVTASGQLLYGYYVWRSDSSQPSTAACALWSLSSANTGTFLAGTSATGTGLVAGQWNFIPLATPFALSTGVTYRVAAGWTGNFNDTQNQFGGGTDPYKSGIVNGPITCFSSPVGQGGANQAPFTNTFQGTFTTAGADPTVSLPSSDDVQSNFFIDVLVGPPAGNAFTPPAVSRGRPAAVRGRSASSPPVAAVPPPVPAPLPPYQAGAPTPAAHRGTAASSGTASSAGAGISIVQAKSAASTSVTLNNPTTAGNCLVVYVTGSGSSAPSVTGVTIGGSASNFAVLKSASTSNGFTQFILATAWACPSCPGGQTAVAVSGTNISSVTVHEVSGLASTSGALLDKFSTGSSASAASSWSSGATTATANAAEYIGGVAIDSGTMTGPASPWANASPVSGSITGSQITTSTGTFTYSGTSSGSAIWAAVVVTLNPGAGGASSGPAGPARTAPGRPGARRGASSASPGVPVTAPPPVAVAPFTAPSAARGRPGAGRGRAASSAGAPVTAPPPVTPAPFTAPTRPARGVPAAVRGTARSRTGTRVQPVTPSPFQAPARNRPRPVAARGRAASARGVAFIAPPTPKTLLISLASKAGTDDYGTAYPQGILATAGVIEGPEFIGVDFIINTSGYFLYDGTPGAGNLVASVTPGTAGGVDNFGNNYVAGSASYQSGLASAITAGSFTTYTGNLFSGWTPKAAMGTNSFGDLLLLAASGRQVITSNNILDGGGGGATFQADVSVNGANLNVGNGSSANINLNPPMATPPNTAAVKAGTATLAQTEACLGALIQSLQNRNMVT